MEKVIHIISCEGLQIINFYNTTRFLFPHVPQRRQRTTQYRNMKCHKISHSFSCSHLSFNRRHSVCCIPKEHIFIYEYLTPFINSCLIFCLFCRLNAFSASHEYVFAAKTVSQTNFLIAHRAFYAFMFLSFYNNTHELRFKEMEQKLMLSGICICCSTGQTNKADFQKIKKVTRNFPI